MLEIIGLICCGALGAFLKEILGDNTIELPKKSGGKLFLGIFGSLIIGAAIGYFVDHSPITAFFAGFTSLQTMERLLKKNPIT